MQKGSFTDKTPRFDTDGTVDRINQLASIFREQSLPVIFIQHENWNRRIRKALNRVGKLSITIGFGGI